MHLNNAYLKKNDKNFDCFLKNQQNICLNFKIFFIFLLVNNLTNQTIKKQTKN